MRGPRLLVGLAAVGALTVACGDGGSQHANDAAPTGGPLTAPLTARGLTAGLLGHLDRDRVSWYGGQHGAEAAESETWSASADVDGDIRSVFAFVQRTPGSSDPGCKPDSADYTELSCTTAPNGAARSLMQRAGGSDRLPVLQGRTMRADGTSFLVEVFADEATDDAEALVLDLLDDEALAGHTTESLNAAGEALDDFQTLELTATTEEG